MSQEKKLSLKTKAGVRQFLEETREQREREAHDWRIVSYGVLENGDIRIRWQNEKTRTFDVDVVPLAAALPTDHHQREEMQAKILERLRKELQPKLPPLPTTKKKKKKRQSFKKPRGSS